MKKILLALLLCLAATPVFAEKAIIVRLPNGKFVGVVYAATGNIILTDIQVLEYPGPSPNPTPVPVPSKVVRAIIVYETDNSTQELATLINRIRNNQQLSRKILILDQHTKDENREPDTEVQAALRLFNGANLPRIAGFDVEGKPVIQEKLPETYEQVLTIMQNWGLLINMNTSVVEPPKGPALVPFKRDN